MRNKVQQCEIDLARAKADLGERGQANAAICLANASAPKDISCDNFLQQLPDDQFNAWVAQIQDPKMRELLSIVHQYKKQREQVRAERDVFVQQVLPSIYKTNKVREEKGLAPLPTDFPTYFAQRELQARTFSTIQSAKPALRTSGKAPVDFVRKQKTPSPKKSPSPIRAVEKPKVGRLGALGAFNPFAQTQALSLFDEEAVRKFIVSQRQSIKSGRLTVDEAIANFQRGISAQERAQVPTPRLRQLESYIRNYTEPLPDDL